MKKRIEFPLPGLTLAAVEFDQLYALCQWLEAMPEYIELSEGSWDHIHEQTTQALDKTMEACGVSSRWWVESVEIDKDHTLVALCNHDSYGPKDVEARVRVIRRPDLKTKRKHK